ncbi:hypothetical protein [Candidatus Berkiella aquae]|uniref:Uncharacterized protein n=1 Tax=Candidatus Berkiella aquae TaxID=295108 RepID=A0A0Q9Z067_9GAMM|nr:hypothetical protein [Candidatus Berkiella aquae]MCS5711981.1 hypothetical protein [Candidatus Berkiella aquae]
MAGTGNYRLILALYEKHDTYLEFYNFGLKQDTHASNNIFLNNHSLFHHFITYFREKGHPILLKAETAKFECKETNYSEDIHNNWMLGLPNEFEKMIVEQMPVAQIYLNGSLDQVFLTREEAIFVRHYLNGFNLEQIKVKMSNSLDDCKAIVNALTKKLNLVSEKDLRSTLIANRIQKKISFIK